MIFFNAITLAGWTIENNGVPDFLTDGEVLSIEFPRDGEMRSRKVVSRSRARSTGKYPSWKMGRMLQWESAHELNAMRLLDASRSVLSFSEQPCLITYRQNNIERRHYPDLLVSFADAKELWEIKSASEAADHEVSARTSIMRRELPRFGYSYRLVAGESFSCEPLISNVKTLLRWGRDTPDIIERSLIVDAFQQHVTFSWGEISGGRLGKKGRQIVCRLLMEGCLETDIRKPLNEDTPIFIPGGSTR